MLGSRLREKYNLLVVMGGIPNNPTSIAGVLELADKVNKKFLYLQFKGLSSIRPKFPNLRSLTYKNINYTCIISTFKKASQFPSNLSTLFIN